MDRSKILDIIHRWYDEYHWHDKIPCDEGIFDGWYIYTTIRYEDADSWEDEDTYRQPEGEYSKYPWSLDDHESLVSLRDESLYEYCLTWDVEWLKKPTIDSIEWYHTCIINISP